MFRFFKFVSLRTKLLIVMLVAIVIASATFAGVRELGNFLVWRNYLDEDKKQARADGYVEEFQEYVKNNKISVKDSEKISSWNAGNYVDIIIYKDSTLFYAPEWFMDINDEEDGAQDGEDGVGIGGGVETEDGVTNNTEEDTDSGEPIEDESTGSIESGDDLESSFETQEFVDKGWFTGDRGFVQYLNKEARETYLKRLDDVLDGNGELNEIYFVDGTLFIMVVDYTEEFVMGVVFVISILAALLVLGVIMVLYFNSTTTRIKHLADSVKTVESGSLDHQIKAEGNDEITELAKDVNSMRNAVVDNMTKERRAWEANAELITAMSHDIRTPLTVLLGYLDLIELQSNDHGCDEYIAACRENALRLKSLSDDMFSYFLVFGQNDMVSGTLCSQSSAGLKQMISERVLLLEEKGFRFVWENELPEIDIMADVTFLGRVIDNVFSNVNKYASSEDEVIISSEIDSDFLTVSVINNVKRDDSHPESTRIGIKTCIRIMEKMGGNFVAERKEDCFAVIMKLPLAKDISE